MGDQMKKPTNWNEKKPFPSHAAIMEAFSRMRQSYKEAYERRREQKRRASRLQRARDAMRRSKTTVARRDGESGAWMWRRIVA